MMVDSVAVHAPQDIQELEIPLVDAQISMSVLQTMVAVIPLLTATIRLRAPSRVMLVQVVTRATAQLAVAVQMWTSVQLIMLDAQMHALTPQDLSRVKHCNHIYYN